MKTFKNTKYTENNECTTIAFCTAEQAPNENYVECDNSELQESGASQLHMIAGVRYYGWL